MEEDRDQLRTENQRLKTSVKEQQIIIDILTVINSTMPEEEINRRLMKKVVTALDAKEAAVFTFSDEPDHMAPVTFVRGKLDSSSLVKTRLDIGIAGWIAKYKMPRVINDVANDPILGKSSGEPPAVHSLLAVPLMYKGKLLGALTAFDSNRPGGFNNDDVRLLTIIGAQAAQILENARHYQREVQLKELERERAAAKEIWEGFLPRQYPTIQGFEIHAGTIPARDIGGDFYDFIRHNEGCLCFTLGDVAGKGVPAAFLMAAIQAQARMLVNRAPSLFPSQILHELNLITGELATSAQYATMIVGCLSGDTDTVMIANGGHPYPLIVRADGAIEECEQSSLFIGKFPAIEYTDTQCQLAPGDILAIATDGIMDAKNPDDEEYGEKRFTAFIKDHRHLPARELYELALADITAFCRTAIQFDDITLMIIKRQ